MNFIRKFLATRRERFAAAAEKAAKAKETREAAIAKFLKEAQDSLRVAGCPVVPWNNSNQESTAGNFYFFGRDKKLHVAQVTVGGGLTMRKV